MTFHSRLLVLLSASFLASCGEKDTEGTTDTAISTTSPTTTDDTSDPEDETGMEPETEEEVKIHGTVRGKILVDVYETVEGVYTEVDVQERYAGVYPFGAIFVGAYDDPRGNGREHYRGQTVLHPTTFDGDDFELDVGLAEAGNVFVIAALDANNNAIVDSIYDSMAAWPFQVSIEDGSLTEGVVIRLTVNLDLLQGGGAGCCGDGTSEGCIVNISGPVDIDRNFDGNGFAMLLGSDGSGPYYGAWFEAATDGSRHSSGTYSMPVCRNAGTVKLVGAIDSNNNGIIDPADTTGSYVTSPNTNGNPISVGESDMTDMEIQMPLYGADGEEEDNGVSLVPFVYLTGTITSGAGTFDDFGAGTSLYVAALKYRPNTSVSASTFEAGAYDSKMFDWSELSGKTSVEYSLVVPANVQLYLWAYADTDLDGVVNEVGEPIGAAPSLDGAVSTGTENLTQNIIVDTL